ncbi:GNAT family acetyltransferase [Pelagicoccus mobilis]|uniref:GNAT family acetyltransferase n=1 Tax=Pelagicoccus mobilis TaxID=415221 RepID=A0A934VQD7_9BACT|nr:GNAT family acetyltransferase [Pelagicoccus mobilis]MBK1876785.1 GNAT family acetyltransferase [Pelagicoccus mobilis]
MTANHPSRFNIVGCSGSGKSTFARKLANKLNAPYVELDALFWGPNWSESTDEIFFQNLDTKLTGDAWVIDGNYTRTIPIKWKHVQTVIWLDLPFTRTFWQALLRATRRAYNKEELWPGTGNTESFRKTFLSHDSILLWTLTSYRTVRRRYQKLLADPQYSHIQFLHFRSHKQANAYLDQLPKIQNNISKSVHSVQSVVNTNATPLMQIRPFQETDRPALIALWKACGLIVAHNDPDRDIERKLQVSPEWFLVGMLDGQLVASCMAGYDGHRGWINYLAVSPDHQNKGFARQLMSAAEASLLAAGCPKINLQIRETNQAVIDFYQKLGYTIDPVVSMGKRLIPDN